MRLPKIDFKWAFISVIASSLIAIGSMMPLWELELIAPQYPQGLFIFAHGYSMSGDIKEINALNHYVGLTPLDPAKIIELKLFPFGVVSVIAVVLFGAVIFNGRKRYWSALASAVIPVVMLADLQYQLYIFGHEIDSDAPLDLENFTPHVLGDTQVMNFHSVARPGTGFWFLIMAFLLLSSGLSLCKWLLRTWNNTGKSHTNQNAVAVVLILLLYSAGSPRSADAKSQPHFSTRLISDEIARADPGETIVIKPGVYEGELIISKPVVLVGEGLPIIDGLQTGDVLTINADDVTLEGFQIRGSSREVTAESAAIRLNGERAVINANKLVDVLYGIVAAESSGHQISNNTIESIATMSPERRGHAIYFHYSNHNLVMNNFLTRSKDGVYLQFSDYNKISENTIRDLRYGTHLMFSNNTTIANNLISHNVSGGVVMFSGDVSFSDNEISYNESAATGYGLMFKEVDDIEVKKNLIHHNNVAIAMEGAPFTPSSSVEVRDNLIGYNNTAVGLFTTTNVLFTGNTFIGNREHVKAVAGSIEFKNQWSQLSRGNYWDDYHGYDSNGDGVGDIEYTYRGVFDSLAEKNPILHGFDYTVARIALELAANWFPIYRPDPRVVDDFPLMRRTLSLESTDAKTRDISDLMVFFILTMVPLALIFKIETNTTRRW